MSMASAERSWPLRWGIGAGLVMMVWVACGTAPDPTPPRDPFANPPHEVSTTPTTTPSTDPASNPGVGSAGETRDVETWTWYDRKDLKLRFKLPQGWNMKQRDGMVFALPKPPADDAAIVFVRAADTKEVDRTLAWLDEVFPMEQVQYIRQSEPRTINGMKALLGEGKGMSTD
ncbi:MAG: hypothetical protein AAFX99_24450, partial [Myxococcota bacterium]